MAKRNTSPLDLFRQELSQLSNDVPTKQLWKALHFVLTDTNNNVDDLREAVRGNGNGERGLIARMQAIESAVKVTQSDVRETLNMMRSLQPVEIVDDDEPEPDPVPERRWFIDKVLPGLVQTGLIAIVAAVVALIVQSNVP